jgi:serine/threonine protein kinase
MPRDPSSAFPASGSGQKLEAGLIIDRRYRLEEFLGRGGMGTVWRATDESLELPVALKFLHEILIRDDAALEDLKRETKRALQLTHPNIVRVHSLVEDSARSLACIGMEFVPGVNLTQRRVRQSTRRFEVEELSKWTVQLCDALQYAHEKAHIVHRDLKPGNLLLDVDNDLKITDFGIAASANESITRLTGGTSGGTLEYMSPQQAQGERPTPRDDLYSLGATLYELLTSEPPFGFQPA